jgi:activator of HSP90 ATPase
MKTIQHTVSFKASPEAIFEALLDSEKHSAFTGAPAAVDRRVGGATSAYGGHVVGINLDIVTNRRIVQAWRPKDFPEGVFTVLSYELAPEGDGTKLTFTQNAVPDSAYEHLNKGWEERYWKPLRAYAEGKKA